MTDTLQYIKIVKYIKKHGEVKLYGGWKWVTYARSLVGIAEINSCWLNYFKDHPKLYDIPDILKESTYSECIDAVLNIVDNKLCMTIVFWDGDDGYPTRKRCKFDIILNSEVTLHPDILDNLTHHSEKIAERQIKFAEEKRLERLIKKRAKMLLSL